MLKGGKGLEDPHQSGESLGARDRAQPRKQGAEVRPGNSPGPSIGPQAGVQMGHRRQARPRRPLFPPVPPSAPPGGTPNLLWEDVTNPPPGASWGIPSFYLSGVLTQAPLSCPGLGKWFPNADLGITTTSKKDGLLIGRCILTTSRTVC